MFKSTGRLEYYQDPYKLIVRVDPEISRYYFSQIPKRISLNHQRYAPHISVVRKEIPINKNNWKRHRNRVIEFEYDHYVHNDQTYFWLNAYCLDLEEIRKELGLTRVSQYTRSPNGDFNTRFHITLGNRKNI